MDSKSISAALDQPEMIVTHVLDVLESQQIVRVAKALSGQYHIRYVSPELKRLMEI